MTAAQISDAREQRERASAAINASVEYVQMMSATTAGFRADHTGDWVVCGWDGTQGDKVHKWARAAMRRLVRHTRGHATSPLKIVEIWSVASVAKFVMELWRTDAWAIEKDDPEVELLQLFPSIVEKLRERRSHRKRNRQRIASHARRLKR